MAARKSSARERDERPKDLDFFATDSGLRITSRTPPDFSGWSARSKKSAKPHLKERLAACERIIHQHPTDAAAYTSKGDLLRELKRFEEALAAYERAIQMGSDSAEAQVGKGVALEHLGRSAEAQDAYRSARELGARQLDQRAQRNRNTQAPDG